MGDFALDNSQIRTYQECPRRFLYRHVWDLSPGLEPWLATGSAWGSAMDVLWKWDKGEAETVLENAIIAFEGTIEEKIPLLSDTGSVDWRISDRYHYHEALADYADKYSSMVREVFDPETTRCEIPFECKMGGFDLIGRFDKQAQERDSGIWWIIEHKTTSGYLSNTYIEKWRNDNQVRTYGYVGRKIWGEKFGGVFVDCVSITKRGRVAMQLVPITFPPLVDGAWQKDMESIAASIFLDRKHNGRFPRNTDACERFGRICPFFEACVVNLDPRSSPSSFGFRVEHWDPREQEWKKTAGQPNLDSRIIRI